MRIKKQVNIYTITEYRNMFNVGLNELCRMAGKPTGGTYAVRTNQHVLSRDNGIRLISEDLATFLKGGA